MSHFPAIRIEGGILGPDTLEQLLAGDLPGLKPKDFGLDGRRTLTDEIAAVFADARAQWELFQRRLERLPEDDLATSVTRDAWMIPFLSLLGYELRFNPRAYEVDGLTFAISHRAGEAEDAPPVHIVGARQELGRLAPTGRPRLAPHSLVQEYLNRTEHLWGIVTNGLTLRLLRDSTYVRRQAYVEFDLRQIFDEQRFTDFAILYQLLHRSRLPRTAHDARDCLLEQYYQHTVEQGGRVRDRLRDGVKECIERLANGFLSHPDNEELRQRVTFLASGEWRVASSGQDRASSEWPALDDETNNPLATPHSPFAILHSPIPPLAPEDLYRQLLRLVYRLLFLLVSEDRGLISADPLYRQHYGVARLRRLLDRRSAYTEHDDIWCSLRVLWKVLSDERLADLLGAAPLNGELFAPLALDDCAITNRDFLEAFWHLAYYRESPSAPPRRVNYAALDVEELGSVYESLLEYHPVIEASGQWQDSANSEWRIANAGSLSPSIRHSPFPIRYSLDVGSERKSTGSYYTPPALVADLVKSALDPVIEERLAEAKRMANGEWRMVSTYIRERFIHEVFPRLPRPGSLAKGDAGGHKGLPADQGISPMGTVRTDQPDAPSSHFDSGEYRRGLGTSLHVGIHTVSASSEWEPHGAGDTSSPERGNQPLLSGSGPSDSGRTSGHRQTIEQPGTQPPTEEELALAWQSTPFAIRHSLFAEHALLSIKVLDPACGSGHFLLAAARRLGKELAKIRTGEDEPTPERVREAIRDVVGHCIYGVDKNPLAVELCRVALWLEAHCEGKPLTFLDHRIRCGDSLVGVLDLDVLEAGIPDEAFAPVSTDAKTTAAQLKKRNRNERRDLESGQLPLPFAPTTVIADLGEKAHDIESIADDSPAAIREKKNRYERLLADPERLRLAKACDLWTAAFFQRLTSELARSPATITTEVVIDQLAGRVHPQALAAAQAIASEQRFFHWPLEFPEVFAQGGFDVALGNPPWDMIQHDPEEFFATREPTIAAAPNMDKRRKMIEHLRNTNPSLYDEFLNQQHLNDCYKKFLHASGRFARTGRGRINMAYVFAELGSMLISKSGRAGLVVPTGLMTDSFAQQFSSSIVENNQLVSLFDFENREKLFPAVDSRMKFCMLTLTGEHESAGTGEDETSHTLPLSRSPALTFAFFATRAEHLRDPRRVFSLTAEDIARINPNTRTLPVFRTRQDADLTRAIYEHVPILVNEKTGENPWNVSFKLMFMMNTDSYLFRTRAELEAQGCRLAGNVFVKGDPHSPSAIRYSPLYEAKMIWHYDHRYGTYEGVSSHSSTQLPTPDEARHADPHFLVQPRYWVPAEEVEARLGEWQRGWLLGFRDVARSTDERTAIFSLLPRVGAGHKAPLIFSESQSSLLVTAWLAHFSSLVLDYVTRQKIGGTSLGFFILRQLPVLPPSAYKAEDLRFIVPRVLELTYTAWDLQLFAQDVWAEADDDLRSALRAQWEANCAATGGHAADLPSWAAAYPQIQPLAARYSPLADSSAHHSPLATRHSPLASPCPFPPFRWDEARRAVLRAELDAYYARLYGLTRKQLRYILDPADLTERELADILDPWEEVEDPLDPAGYAARAAASTFPGETFRVLKEKEMRQFGEYRTRRLVLQAWEKFDMANGEW